MLQLNLYKYRTVFEFQGLGEASQLSLKISDGIGTSLQGWQMSGDTCGSPLHFTG